MKDLRRLIMGLAILGLLAPAVLAQTTAPAVTDEPAPEWTKPVPLSFTAGYVLASDYIFRGINFSEYEGEGREEPNHQLTAGVAYDTGNFGKIGFVSWFEWFAGQDQIQSGDSCKDLQEVDYTLYWNYTIAPLGTTVETGWIAYTFPPYSGDAHTDYEWYVKLSQDDSKWFGTEKPVLNPYIAYYYDLDLAENAGWAEVGVSHTFALADLGMSDTPFLKNVSVTPSLVMGVDHRYYGGLGLAGADKTTRLANLNYGLAVAYDLFGALNVDPKYGTMSVGTFVNFSQALEDGPINDEFYGGLSVTYGW